MKRPVVPEDVQPIVVAALYKFAKLPDYAALREPLLDFCRRHTVYGTLLLANEGINGTIAGSRAGIDAVLAYLRADVRLGDLQAKESLTHEMPFLRMKVKLKKEIVTLGVSDIDPAENVGRYVPPKDWNTLITDPEVLLIDTRNCYEVAIGSFENAVNPGTTHFREFPDYVERHMQIDKDKKIAMFCTGGIRCEKATAYLLKQGFKNVYHLQGGILKYLEEIPPAESLWQGECFVFDARVAVDHDLSKGCYTQCYGCRHPLSADDTQSPHYQAGVCCPYCYASLNEDKRSRVEQRHKQVQLAKARGERHLGAAANSKKRDKLMI